MLYAKYKHEKLMEHLKLFSAKLNIPKLIRVCEEMTHWKELAFLYVAYDEYDNAATCMITHSEEAWDNIQFKASAGSWGNVCGCRGMQETRGDCSPVPRCRFTF